MMQEALKRGQEIIVQVLKEGLGSKGPTVTSYLSIPGRLLVMMPDMDNVGVSRKVEDEEGRRKMRKILDSLDLPAGFGFILRTAGFTATRTELARDAQYLTRLWQVMDKRMHAVGAPCQLYAEGDILLRTIRDSIDQSVDGIVVDSEQAFHRAKAFLEVVSPRTATKVHFYDRKTPVFHAFDVERQVDLLHTREVPLPSGGALVFDQAEALVAIDVNSGRSRSARDSETNAYQTNQEAVDEIARQLRLRDLGGVVVCDLIDMRSAKHRRDIEERFKKHLARDRAKTTVGTISEFGILELTRQRMRPSISKTHYADCPHCAGSGEIRMPDSVAADAMRRVQLILDMERVARVEVVCSTRVASMLLSRRRRALVELEDLFSKRIDIRISESIAADRVDLYAYDERNADVDLDRPQKPVAPALASLPTEIDEDDEGAIAPSQGQSQGGGGRKRRRRRRKPAAADATSLILAGGFDDLPDIDEDEGSLSDALDSVEDDDADESTEGDERGGSAGGAARSDEDGERGGRRGRRRRRRRGGRDRAEGDESDSDRGAGTAPAAAPKPAPLPPPPPREPSDPIRVHAIAKEMELTRRKCSRSAPSSASRWRVTSRSSRANRATSCARPTGSRRSMCPSRHPSRRLRSRPRTRHRMTARLAKADASAVAGGAGAVDAGVARMASRMGWRADRRPALRLRMTTATTTVTTTATTSRARMRRRTPATRPRRTRPTSRIPSRVPRMPTTTRATVKARARPRRRTTRRASAAVGAAVADARTVAATIASRHRRRSGRRRPPDPRRRSVGPGRAIARTSRRTALETALIPAARTRPRVQPGVQPGAQPRAQPRARPSPLRRTPHGTTKAPPASPTRARVVAAATPDPAAVASRTDARGAATRPSRRQRPSRAPRSRRSPTRSRRQSPRRSRQPSLRPSRARSTAAASASSRPASGRRVAATSEPPSPPALRPRLDRVDRDERARRRP